MNDFRLFTWSTAFFYLSAPFGITEVANEIATDEAMRHHRPRDDEHLGHCDINIGA